MLGLRSDGKRATEGHGTALWGSLQSHLEDTRGCFMRPKESPEEMMVLTTHTPLCEVMDVLLINLTVVMIS